MGNSSRDHAQSTSDGQGNPTLAASYSELLAALGNVVYLADLYDRSDGNYSDAYEAFVEGASQDVWAEARALVARANAPERTYSQAEVDAILRAAFPRVEQVEPPRAILTSAMIQSWRRDPGVVAAVNPHGRSHPRIDLPTKLAEWACDFEDAAKDAPTHLQAVVLKTRAAECRDALRNIYGQAEGTRPAMLFEELQTLKAVAAPFADPVRVVSASATGVQTTHIEVFGRELADLREMLGVSDGTGRDPSPSVTSDAVPGTNTSNPKGEEQ